MQLDTPLFSAASNSVNLGIQHLFPITGGVININLPASPSISYLFRVLERTEIVTYLDASGEQWTGPVFTCPETGTLYGGIKGDLGPILTMEVESEDKPLYEFRSILPESASISFLDLSPTGVTTEVLDTSLARLASLIVSDAQTLQRLASSLLSIPEFADALQQP